MWVDALVVLDVLSVERIIREAGAERVTEEAGAKLAEVLEERAQAIAERAIRLAKYAHKKTITKKEIELAILFEAPGLAVVEEKENGHAKARHRSVPSAV